MWVGTVLQSLLEAKAYGFEGEGDRSLLDRRSVAIDETSAIWCDRRGAAIDDETILAGQSRQDDLASAISKARSRRRVWGLRRDLHSLFLLFLSLSLGVYDPEMIWRENMNENDFMCVLGYFTVKGEKHFGKAFQLTEFTGSTKHLSFTEKHFRK